MTRTVVGDEAYTVLTAAADTTGNAMTTITHYVLSDRMIYNKLHAELKAVFPSDTMILDFASLERLPYLTVVSMSSWLLHHDETYFPNPTKFDPDRWGDATDAYKMEKAFVPFGKGSRACLGMNLAYCELYVSIGTLFRRFPNLTSNNLSGEELAYDDYFSSYTPLGQRKLHIMSALESKKA
ncbi:MAG: hypothetical protein Q9202_003635 [Teloschistes flavicans]